MASPPQPPQLFQPPIHPQQGPPKKKHTGRTVLLVIGSVFAVLIAIAIASGGGDTTKPGAGSNNPATAPAATKAVEPKAPATKVACADQDAPCVVTVGSAFALGKHQVLAGWTIKDSGIGLTIVGKAKNISDDASTMFVTVKFLRGDEVMANVMCNTGELLAGQIETMNCLPEGTYTTNFDKVTAEAAF
ncbi:hypothetical protein EV138_5562 [Kribbella voronezhensis]|uniref:Uncharacterized protein n=1 Tax=Kribbella voronezhensis TaxID=2512212 RepID=A0A4R7TIZ5_9ACTN|nr:hypothetical protein [Kribbella voronezhensis]TDU91949.1 hypothetical protein EV138_5562 [Kribbella voronezhensis]